MSMARIILFVALLFSHLYWHTAHVWKMIQIKLKSNHSFMNSLIYREFQCLNLGLRKDFIIRVMNRSRDITPSKPPCINLSFIFEEFVLSKLLYLYSFKANSSLYFVNFCSVQKCNLHLSKIFKNSCFIRKY